MAKLDALGQARRARSIYLDRGVLGIDRQKRVNVGLRIPPNREPRPIMDSTIHAEMQGCGVAMGFDSRGHGNKSGTDKQDVHACVQQNCGHFRRSKTPVYRDEHDIRFECPDQQLEEKVRVLPQIANPRLRRRTCGDKAVGDAARVAVEICITDGSVAKNLRLRVRLKPGPSAKQVSQDACISGIVHIPSPLAAVVQSCMDLSLSYCSVQRISAICRRRLRSLAPHFRIASQPDKKRSRQPQSRQAYSSADIATSARPRRPQARLPIQTLPVLRPLIDQVGEDQTRQESQRRARARSSGIILDLGREPQTLGAVTPPGAGRSR